MDQGTSGTAEAHLRGQLRQVGRLLRSLRLQRGLSMQQLSGTTGISTAMISLVERGLASPSLTTLSALGGAFSLSLGDLFTGSVPPIRVTNTDAAEAKAEALARRVLADRLADGFRVCLDRWPPGARLQLDVDGAGCTEIVSVLSGELVMSVNGSSQVIGLGESVEFVVTQPIVLRNTGASPSESIWITRC